jgi:hypothetical protein
MRWHFGQVSQAQLAKCMGIKTIYITGDTHRDFRRVDAFCGTVESSKDDILIILVDVEINYFS